MHANGIIKVLEDFGVKNYQVYSDNVQLSCLFSHLHAHGMDHKPSMGISVFPGGSSLVNCFACGYKNSLLWAVKEYGELKGINVTDIVKNILEAEKITADNILAELEEINRPKEEEILTLDESILDEFPARGSKYLLDRGITLETQKTWGVRQDIKRNRVLLPVRDVFGCLVGAVGRLTINDHNLPKMYNYFNFKKSKCLFGEQFVRKDKLIICEGPIDAISVWSEIKNTDYDVVALMGSIISKDQLSAILNLTKEVYLFMDNDAVGLSSTMKNGKQLMGRILTHYVEYDQDEFGEDPNSLIQKNINIIDRLESASVINTSWNG